MHRDQFLDRLDAMQSQITELFQAANKEYASADNVFANFDGDAKDLGIDRKKDLWIFANKHRRGIEAFLRGHVSQREPVQGRIKDLIVYLFLLWAMVDQEENNSSPKTILVDVLPKENKATYLR